MSSPASTLWSRARATEFVFASQLIVSDQLRTLPIGLSAIMGQYTVNWGLLMAGTVLMVVWGAGKIFRTGLLMQGKSATIAEVLRWAIAR